MVAIAGWACFAGPVVYGAPVGRSGKGEALQRLVSEYGWGAVFALVVGLLLVAALFTALKKRTFKRFQENTGGLGLWTAIRNPFAKRKCDWCDLKIDGEGRTRGGQRFCSDFCFTASAPIERRALTPQEARSVLQTALQDLRLIDACLDGPEPDVAQAADVLTALRLSLHGLISGVREVAASAAPREAGLLEAAAVGAAAAGLELLVSLVADGICDELDIEVSNTDDVVGLLKGLGVAAMTGKDRRLGPLRERIDRTRLVVLKAHDALTDARPGPAA